MTTYFTEIEVEGVRGSALTPHTAVLNQLAADNIDEGATEKGGFRIVMHKIVLQGYWGVERTAEEDLQRFGELMPDVRLIVTEVYQPKPNGNLSALKNYARREYLNGKCVAQYTPQPIEWVKREF